MNIWHEESLDTIALVIHPHSNHVLPYGFLVDSSLMCGFEFHYL